MHRIDQVHPQPGSPPYDILQSPFAKNLTSSVWFSTPCPEVSSYVRSHQDRW